MDSLEGLDFREAYRSAAPVKAIEAFAARDRKIEATQCSTPRAKSAKLLGKVASGICDMRYRAALLVVISLLAGSLAAGVWPSLARDHPALVWLGAALLVLSCALAVDAHKRRALCRRIDALEAAHARAVASVAYHQSRAAEIQQQRQWAQHRDHVRSNAPSDLTPASENHVDDEGPIDWYARQIETLDIAARKDPDHLRRATVLNKRESAIHDICLAWAEEHHFRLTPQANIGAFVKTRDSGPAAKAVHSTYNSKRVDFLICSTNWWPQIVVEHQGGGHGQGDAEGRFAVKQRVFDRLLLPLVETVDNEPAASVRAKLDAALREARRSSDIYWNRARALREDPSDGDEA